MLERRLCIFTPPKTGSTSLHKLLCNQPYDGLMVVGVSLDGRTDKHTCIVPAEATDFRLVLIVRHPLDRLVSVWHHLVRFDAWQGRATQSFAAFAEQVARGEQPDPFLAWNLCQHTASMTRPVTVVKLETMAAGLTEIGLPIEPERLPRLNSAYRKRWEDYFNPHLLTAVESWARPDCERFGYDWPPT